MARRYETISFLTDYGLVDEFVGVCKAVIRDVAPHAAVIDLTHGIRPFDVRAGALALARCVSYVPDGVILAVVDPAVGTERRAVAIEVAGGNGVFVGPDNGLLAPAVAMAGGAERAVVLTNTDYHLAAVGTTFAGRDVFAPAAAHLCNGVDLSELGEPVDPAALMPGMVPLPREENGALVAEVLWVDRFGNCQLNVGPGDVEEWGETLLVEIVDAVSGQPSVRAARRVGTFAEIGSGSVGLVVDSSGLLALALDQRNAAEELGLTGGTGVVLRRVDPSDAPVTPAVTASVQLRRR